MSCDVSCKCSSDPELLWLWCRLAAVAPIRALAREHPYAMSVALKSKKKNEVVPGSRCLTANPGARAPAGSVTPTQSSCLGGSCTPDYLMKLQRPGSQSPHTQRHIQLEGLTTPKANHGPPQEPQPGRTPPGLQELALGLQHSIAHPPTPRPPL